MGAYIPKAQVRIDKETYLAGQFLISRLVQRLGYKESGNLMLDLLGEAEGPNPGSGADQARLAAKILHNRRASHLFRDLRKKFEAGEVSGALAETLAERMGK